MIKQDDCINNPEHYTSGDIECIDAIKASMGRRAFLGYLKGNALKYLWRYERKEGSNSLEKAGVYIEWLIRESLLGDFRSTDCIDNIKSEKSLYEQQLTDPEFKEENMEMYHKIAKMWCEE